MPLLFKGKIEGVKNTTFDNTPRCALQFIERKADGSIDHIQIKVPTNVPQTEFKVGRDVTVPVLFSSMDNKVYFRIDADAYVDMLARK